jgi:hypothetical protein
MTRTHPSPLFPALIALACLAACGHGHYKSGHVPIGGGAGGPIHESEPNDDEAHANYLGSVRVGDYLEIEGHLTECCVDEYDGFAFYALEPVSVHITLHEANPFADLDFAIWLPEVHDVVDAWETDNHPEFGIFNFAGPGEFHIVLNSWIGASAYLLVVDVQPLNLGMTNGDSPGPEVAPESALSSGRASAPSQLSHERFGAYRAAPAAEGDLRIELRTEDATPVAPPGRAEIER